MMYDERVSIDWIADGFMGTMRRLLFKQLVFG